MNRWLIVPACLAATTLTGCVERTMSVQSNPQGALVYMNGKEVGRTPFERDFTWYGTYDVQVRKDGYETLNQPTPVIAPWWQWPPFDFFAELLPLNLKDQRQLTYELQPTAFGHVDGQAMLARSDELRNMLESSQAEDVTEDADAHAPATQPAK